MQPRDAIISVDGERVPAGEFKEVIGGHSPGDRVTLEISRPGDDGDDPFDVTVRLAENDDGGALLGIRYSFPGMSFHVNPDFREHLEGMGRDMRNRLEDGRRRLDFLELRPEDNSEM